MAAWAISGMIKGFGFPGQRDYSYIQLIDFNARFYSPTLGRFIQPDSVIPDLTNPQSLNRFSYALNSPLVFIDPSGHIPEWECGFSYGGCSTSSDSETDIDDLVNVKSENFCHNHPRHERCFKDNSEGKIGKVYDYLPGFHSDFLNPFGEYSDAKQWAYDSALEFYYGGKETLLAEAQECFTYHTPDECNNPFWENNPHGPDVVKGEDGFYLGVLSTQLDSNSNNLFFARLLISAQADLQTGDDGRNWDPWWLYALMTNPDLVKEAAISTYNIMLNSPHGYDPDYLEFIHNLQATGN
jgi:RHS repeat-associated protein